MNGNRVVDVTVYPADYGFFPDTLAELLRAEIEHFFEVYKTLEPGKYSETGGYEGIDAAWKEIAAARARVQS